MVKACREGNEAVYSLRSPVCWHERPICSDMTTFAQVWHLISPMLLSPAAAFLVLSFHRIDCQCVTPYRKRIGASLIPLLQKQQIVSHLILTPSLS